MKGIPLLGGGGPITDPLLEEEDIPMDAICPDQIAVAETRATIMDALASYKAHRAYLTSDQWTLVPFDGGDGVACFALSSEHADHIHRFTKATGTVIGKTADEIARRHRDTNKITRLNWDTDLADIGPVKILSANEALGISLDVQWAIVQPYVPSLRREHVFYQWCQSKPCDRPEKANLTDKSWIIISSTTSHYRRTRPDPKKASDRITLFSVMLLEPLTPACPRPEDESILPIPRTSVTLMGWSSPQDLDTALARRIAFLQTVKF